MRKMGIDMGTKNVGIALSDESGTMAFPHSVIKNDANLQSNIESIVAAERVAEIVIGHSLDKSGKANSVHQAAEKLMVDLTLTVGLPIHLEPEQYSTQAAVRIQGKDSNTDAAAAALILDSWLRRGQGKSVFDELNE